MPPPRQRVVADPASLSPASLKRELKRFGMKPGSQAYMAKTLCSLQAAMANLNLQHELDNGPPVAPSQVENSANPPSMPAEPSAGIKAPVPRKASSKKLVKASALGPRNDFLGPCASPAIAAPEIAPARHEASVSSFVPPVHSAVAAQDSIRQPVPAPAPPAPLSSRGRSAARSATTLDAEIMQRIVSDAYLYQRILLQQTIEMADILAAVQRPRDAGEAPFVVTKAQLHRWLTHEGVAFSQAWR